MAAATPQTRSFARPGAVVRTAAPAQLAGPAQMVLAVSGTIERVLWFSADNGKCGLVLSTESGKSIKLVGGAAFTPVIGKAVEASAKIERHPKYGEQFVAEIIYEARPQSVNGIAAYLALEIEGVGKTTAERIVAHFGAKTLEVLDGNIGRIKEVPGIKASQVDSIRASWTANTVIRQLSTTLSGLGLKTSISLRIYAQYKEESISIVTTQPYRLVDLDGVGFKTADAIAMSLGTIGRDDPKRIAGAMEFVLDQASKSGHTAVTTDALLGEIIKMTGVVRAKGNEILQAEVNRGSLIPRDIRGHAAVSYRIHGFVAAERAIAGDVARLAGANRPAMDVSQAARNKAKHLNDLDQETAIANAFEHQVSVITGRPGCGKTTVTKEIAAAARDFGLDFKLCAPTGKAARRITEATGFIAETVHSLLRARPDGEAQFNRENPLTAKVFIIDEMSMLDTITTAALLEALPTGARVVFVGDADQLPSVSAGNVLNDLIASGSIPVTELKTPHRNALDSDIIKAAHRIIEGDVNGLDLEGTKDFRFVPADEDSDTVVAVVQECVKLIAKHGLENVQVLASRYATESGVHALNDAIRVAVNPKKLERAEIEVFGTLFREGDRVIRTATSKELGISNGETGVIRKIDPEKKVLDIEFSGKVIPHDRKDMQAVELAYAITAHKSQGSEYSGVVLVMPRAHKFMMNRNLLYTAITRGKKDVRIVGAADCVRSTVAKSGSARMTGLSEELRAAFSGLSAPHQAERRRRFR